MLRRRSLGASGIEVSVLGLGGNVFGPPRLDLAAARAVIDAALDLGVTFLDTANVYGQGHSEAIVGEVLAGRRERMVLATKFNLRGLENPAGLRDHVRAQAHASLRDLRTDVIDLYQLHHAPSDDVSALELLTVLDELVCEGSVRAVGVCNAASWRLAQWQEVSRTNGLVSVATVQNYWHLLARGVEAEVVPYCQRSGIGVIPYHPLGGGYLSGKYQHGTPRPAGTRGAAGSPIIEVMDTPDTHARVRALEQLAADHQRSAAELAVAWLADQQVVSSVITGVSNPGQLAQNVAGASWHLSDDLREAVAAVVGDVPSLERLPYSMPPR